MKRSKLDEYLEPFRRYGKRHQTRIPNREREALEREHRAIMCESQFDQEDRLGFLGEWNND